MFIKNITIKNFRIFRKFKMDINVPDQKNEGSGLTLLVGENGTGKSSLLEALSLPVVPSDGWIVKKEDFDNSDSAKEIKINVRMSEKFVVEYPNPLSSKEKLCFEADGFCFRTRQGLSEIEGKREFLKIAGRKRVGFDAKTRDAKFGNNVVLFFRRGRLFKSLSGKGDEGSQNFSIRNFNYQYLDTIGVGDIFSLINGYSDSGFGTSNTSTNNAFQAACRRFEKFRRLYESDEQEDTLPKHWNYYPDRLMRGIEVARTLLGAEGDSPLPFSRIGSGYGGLFPFLYFYFLAEQSERKLVILIDEPETHLHPRIQQGFVDFLFEESKSVQIVLATHSPLLVRQILQKEKPMKQEGATRIKVLKSDGVKTPKMEMEKQVLPYVSANEVNYIAFNLVTEEYHNELYERLRLNYVCYLQQHPDAFERLINKGNLKRSPKYSHCGKRCLLPRKRNSPEQMRLDQFDDWFFVNVGRKYSMEQQRYKPTRGDKPKGEKQSVEGGEQERQKHTCNATLHRYIRNQIHHSGDYNPIDPKELEESIKAMRKFFDTEEGKNRDEE